MSTHHLVSDSSEATTSSDYAAGYAAGYAARDAEVDALQRIADFWYFRANNPRSEWPEVKVVNSIIDGMERAEQWRKKCEELDAREKELFQRARELIADGMEDIDVAKQVGLFVPIVENLRAGVL